MDPDVNQVENIKNHISEEEAKALNDILDRIRG